MEFRIDAGVKVDLATPDEVRSIVNGALSGWREELARGTKYRHPASFGNATAAGVLDVNQSSPGAAGPAEGFVWAITRITVTGLTAAETLTAYINEATPMLAVASFIATSTPLILAARGLVLNPGDRLVLAGTGLTANKTYVAACEVTELPVQLRSRLL